MQIDARTVRSMPPRELERVQRRAADDEHDVPMVGAIDPDSSLGLELRSFLSGLSRDVGQLATSLLTEEPGDGSVNCLELAVAAARPGRDEVVFLKDRRGAAPSNANRAGHVLIRDKTTGEVRDLMAGGSTFDGVEAWIAGQPSAGDGAAYKVEGAMAATVRDVLALPPDQRAARIVA